MTSRESLERGAIIGTICLALAAAAFIGVIYFIATHWK